LRSAGGEADPVSSATAPPPRGRPPRRSREPPPEPAGPFPSGLPQCAADENGLADHLLEEPEVERVRPVAKRPVRIGVDLEEKRVDPHGHGGPRQPGDEAPLA